jgi:hypothetical protein
LAISGVGAAPSMELSMIGGQLSILTVTTFPPE